MCSSTNCQCVTGTPRNQRSTFIKWKLCHLCLQQAQWCGHLHGKTTARRPHTNLIPSDSGAMLLKARFAIFSRGSTRTRTSSWGRFVSWMPWNPRHTCRHYLPSRVLLLSTLSTHGGTLVPNIARSENRAYYNGFATELAPKIHCSKDLTYTTSGA